MDKRDPNEANINILKGTANELDREDQQEESNNDQEMQENKPIDLSDTPAQDQELKDRTTQNFDQNQNLAGKNFACCNLIIHLQGGCAPLRPSVAR